MGDQPLDDKRMSRRSVDPVDLWVSATGPQATERESGRTLTEEQPRSAFWRSFSQLPVAEQAETMRKIILQWPYPQEYYASVLPRFVMPGLTFVSAALIGTSVFNF